MTLETEEGCIVTQVKELEITSCCEIDSDIGVNIINAEDPNCSNSLDGSISVAGSGGDPGYQYSINGGPFTGSANFFNLDGGQYDIGVIDIKGCETQIQEVLVAPPPLIVDAGEDQTVDLGFMANINANYTPSGSAVDIVWSPDTLLSCSNCLDFSLTPPGQTTYTITITDQDGCTSTDNVTIFVTDNRPIYIPNAFTPNRDGVNDFVAVFSGPAAVEVTSMQVYDRWGLLVWEGNNFPTNDPNIGWDGTYRGKPMNQGVFVYKAVVRFIDESELLF